MSTVFIPRDGSEYTEHPSGLMVEYRDASHRYWLHTASDRVSVPSVTGILRVLAKDALIPWAEARGIEGALRAVAAGDINPADPASVASAVGTVRALGLGQDAAKQEGADRGTSLHDALQAYIENGKPPAIAEFPTEHRGYVQALCRWLLAARPEPTAVEVCVGSLQHGFAGRLDLRAVIDGRDLVVDLKTNAKGRVYDEPHAQCAAYVGALVECGHPEPDGAVVVALGEDGGYESVECEASYEDFLSILAAHRVMARLRGARAARERAAKKAAA